MCDCFVGDLKKHVVSRVVSDTTDEEQKQNLFPSITLDASIGGTDTATSFIFLFLRAISGPT